MPYKDPEDRKGNRAYHKHEYLAYERTFAIKRFRAMGLEPLDIDDPMSDLLCGICGKQTKRVEKSWRRHEPSCVYADQPYLSAKTPRHLIH